MKVNMTDFAPAAADIAEMILSMPGALESEQEATFKSIGQTIKAETIKSMRRSIVAQKTNYDGSVPYLHMEDDVKVTLKGRKTGLYSVTVHGGKKTAFKWHLLDSGTRNPDGTVHTEATQFVSIAIKNSEQGIEAALEELERKVANS